MHQSLEKTVEGVESKPADVHIQLVNFSFFSDLVKTRRRPRRCSNKTSMSRTRRKKPKNSFEFIYGGSMPIYHGACVCAFPAIRANKLVTLSLIIPPTSRKTSTHVHVDTGRKIRPSNTTQDSDPHARRASRMCNATNFTGN